MVFLQNNGQTITTQLTPNCNAAATASFDLNDSTTIIFYTNQVPIWSALVSVGIPEVMLIEPITVGSVTLVSATGSPFTINFNAMGRDLYTLILSGKIIDSKTTYPFAGQSLGTFSSAPAAKMAIRSLRIPYKL